MSELSEIRNMIATIAKDTAATAEAMSWVKTSIAGNKSDLERHVEHDDRRLDEHDRRMSRIENRQHWIAGFYSAISAGLAVWGERFFGGHVS